MRHEKLPEYLECLLSSFARNCGWHTSSLNIHEQGFLNYAENRLAWGRFEEQATRVIYGSSVIDKMGVNIEYTRGLCRRIFRGADVNVPLARRLQRGNAHALAWAIDCLVLNGEWPLTNLMIRRIHCILYFGLGQWSGSRASNIRIPEGVVPGEFRTQVVRTRIVDLRSGEQRTVQLVSPRAVPEYMMLWIELMNKDRVRIKPYKAARAVGDPMPIPFDPYECAAKHYHRFVNIHPFSDGGGRISRIILNCLVLMFADHLMPIGDREGEEEHYLHLATKASFCFYRTGRFKWDEDEDKELVHREMALFMLAKAPRLEGARFTAKIHVR
ncbi:hypothetical protein RRF57_009574 [Xylaria bambusicola]|uniref:Fido domain-containing protein n=1 Tax=Xylaria bambusicola TaxID=326684 RepID=A0AAN7Z1S5_9PEZI